MLALFSVASVLGLAPGWVYLSMTTASVIAGSSEAGAIVLTPSLGMLKWISSGPLLELGVELAVRIA